MQRSTQRNGLINLLALLLVGCAGFAVARISHSLAGQIAAVFTGIGALVALVSWFQMRLEERERLEKLELEELTKGKGGSQLFETREAELFPAQRSREQFERFFVPGFTLFLLLLEGIGAWLLWSSLKSGPPLVGVVKPTQTLAMFSIFALIMFLLGRFSATIARLEDHRLLRPAASWLLLSAYLFFIVSLGIVGIEAGFPRTDYYVAVALAILLGLLAIETLVSLILEMYRPRVKGAVRRPLYESRLVGLLGQPEGLITTAAHALDYQFGFKVSETWFYRLMVNAVEWVLLLQLLALLLSTSFVIIEAGEHGLLERFGRPVQGRTILGPGAHLKWPWPIDRVYRYRTEEIQSFNIGFTPDPMLEAQPTVLWTVAHASEENFLVANRDATPDSVTNTVSGKPAPQVSLLTVSIPVQFQITNLLAWAYNNQSPTNLLQQIATREVVRYLAGVDFGEVMSTERLSSGRILTDRIQAAANARKLGARILFVGLQDIHPPVAVAPYFEMVIAAAQTNRAKVLNAQANAIRTNNLAAANAANLLNQARSYRLNQEVGSLAQAALFTNQIPAYEAAPSVYLNRAYLAALGRGAAGARKIILMTTNAHDVLTFDLQSQIPPELLGVKVVPDAPSPKK